MVRYQKGFQQGLTKYSTSTNEYQKAVNLELQQHGYQQELTTHPTSTNEFQKAVNLELPQNDYQQTAFSTFTNEYQKCRQSEVAFYHVRKNQKVTLLPDRLGGRIHLELECHPIQLHYSISPEYA